MRARVTVAEARGSVPRPAGTSMIVTETGQEGTIGGGTLEWEATRAARARLGRAGVFVDRHALGPSLGQCCGGSVTLVTEIGEMAVEAGGIRALRLPGPGAEAPPPLTGAFALSQGWMLERTRARAPLWIWGAGHVGRAVVATLAPLGAYEITWIDVGSDRFPADLHGAARLVAAEPAAPVPHAPQAALPLILTHSHEIDLSLCHALLSRGFAGCGLIGSDTKWARFRSRLAALGHAEDATAAIACPIGDPALGKHPQAIAIGLAARLLGTGRLGRAPLASRRTG